MYDVSAIDSKIEIHLSSHKRITQTLLLMMPVLLPLLLLIGSGLRGLDFGSHWDEKRWQIGPVKTMIETGILLPEYYHYPSFNYWVSSAGLIPDILTMWSEKGHRQQRLLQVLESYAYLLTFPYRDFSKYGCWFLDDTRLCTKSHSWAVFSWAKWSYLASKSPHNEAKKFSLTCTSDF